MKKKNLSAALLCIILTIVAVSVAIFSLTGCSDTFKKRLPESTYYTLRNEDNTRAEGSNIRIMSYNLLVEAWAGSWQSVSDGFGSDTRYRAEMFGEVLHHYSPDVIGIQEVDEKWHKYLNTDLIGDYEVIFDKGSEYTSMMYNTKTVRLIDSGKQYYTERTDKRMRYFCWGVFESIDSGKQFIVTNTHMDFGDNKAKQDAQAIEMGDIVRHIEEQYPEAVLFMTGDFNAMEADGAYGVVEYPKERTDSASDVYESIMESVGVIDTKFYGVTNDVSDYITSCGDWDTYTDKSDEDKKSIDWYWEHPSWDHIFVRDDGKVIPKSFRLLSNRMYQQISDHFPIMLDAYIA